jgi:hypothetical protein
MELTVSLLYPRGPFATIHVSASTERRSHREAGEAQRTSREAADERYAFAWT